MANQSYATAHERRTVQVKGYGLGAVTGVLHPVQTELVAHVGDVVGLTVQTLLLLHWGPDELAVVGDV